MKITRKSPFTGKIVTLDLDITEKQMQAYRDGALVQNAFPNLNADEREFIITGLIPGEWDKMLGEEE